MKTFLKLAVLTAILPTAGCMWGRMQVNDPTIAERAAWIRPGETKGSDLRRILGADPTMRLPDREATMLGYTYADTKSHGLILILFNFTKTQTVTDTLYVAVDPKTDLVKKVHIPRRHELKWKFWPFDHEED